MYALAVSLNANEYLCCVSMVAQWHALRRTHPQKNHCKTCQHWVPRSYGCHKRLTWKETTASVIMEAQIMERAFFLLRRPE